MYWASIDKPAVKMASLRGINKVTLLNESEADYTGITLYNNCLYISDSSRRSVFYFVSGFSRELTTFNCIKVYLNFCRHAI